jgi:FG-GAP-like repeat
LSSTLSRHGGIAVIACVLIVAPAGCGGGDDSGLTARDVAEDAGIARTTQTHGENCVFDYDGDGTMDLFLSNHEQAPWQLFRGLPDGEFVETNRGTFPLRDRHGCATADFNGDRLPDIYASLGACMGTCQAAKELWIQGEGGTFTDAAAQYGITDPGGRGRLPVALNANGDKRPDLFTGQSVGVRYPSPNRLWVNEGHRFVNPPGLPTEEIDNQCDTAGDFDGDDYDELIVCGGQVAGNVFRIYDNDRGKWSVANKAVGVPPYGRADAQLADLNGDGNLDLVAIAAYVEVRLNRSGRFPVLDYRLPLPDARNLAVGDAEGDGDQDIYVLRSNNANVPDVMLLNDGSGKGFTEFSDMPQATTGEGDTVQAIPNWKGTRRAAFLVNNGFEDAQGPRQLIEFEGS